MAVQCDINSPRPQLPFVSSNGYYGYIPKVQQNNFHTPNNGQQQQLQGQHEFLSENLCMDVDDCNSSRFIQSNNHNNNNGFERNHNNSSGNLMGNLQNTFQCVVQGSEKGNSFFGARKRSLNDEIVCSPSTKKFREEPLVTNVFSAMQDFQPQKTRNPISDWPTCTMMRHYY